MAWTSAQRVNGMQLNYEPCMQGLALLYSATTVARDSTRFHRWHSLS